MLADVSNANFSMRQIGHAHDNGALTCRDICVVQDAFGKPKPPGCARPLVAEIVWLRYRKTRSLSHFPAEGRPALQGGLLVIYRFTGR